MRLIDVDVLLKDLREDPLFPIVEGYNITGKIETQPIVDAVSREKYEAREETRKILVEFADDLLAELKERVEVVRCEDCKYNGAWCDIQDIEWTEKGKPIEFCSYGERKEDGN